MDDDWKTSGNVATVRIRSLMEAIPQNRFHNFNIYFFVD